MADKILTPIEEAQAAAIEPSFDTWYDKVVYYDQKYVDFYMEKLGHLSFSSLKRFKESPFTFLKHKVFPSESTKAMDFGSMVHMILFEPELFKTSYYVLDDRKILNGLESKFAKPKSSGDYQKWKKEQLEKAGSKTIVGISDIVTAKAAVKRMVANKEFLELFKRLRSGKKEHSVISNVNGYPVKKILDIDGDDLLFDLKVVNDNSLRSTTNAYWGEQQLTWVQQGLYAQHYDFKKPVVIGYLNHDGDIRLRPVPTDELKRGFAEFSQWLYSFDTCLRTTRTFLHDSNYWIDANQNLLSAPYWIADKD